MARLNAKYKAVLDKYKGTKAYEVMKKCGGTDYRLTWAEVKACLAKEGKKEDEINKHHKLWINATKWLS